MTRKEPLRRKTRLSPRRAKPRRSGRVRDSEYMAWVRTLPCVACGQHEQVDAHHMTEGTGRGLSQKPSDHTAVPMCRLDHMRWHDATGCFKGWTKLERFGFAVSTVHTIQNEWETWGRASHRQGKDAA